MLSFSKFITESSKNLIFNFFYNNELVSFVGNSKKDIYCDVLDWLYNNGYDFKDDVISDKQLEDLLLNTSYRKDHFYNIANSGNNIKILSPGTNFLASNGLITKMLINIGAKDMELLNDETDDIETNDDAKSDRYFLLGAWGKRTGDLSKTYVDNGYWLNGYAVHGEDKFKNAVNKIPVGGNVVIKATYTKGGLSVMEIRAKGIVTKNYNDGTKLDVNWDKNFKSFKLVESRLGAYRSTVHELKNTELIDLIFNHSESDRVIPPIEFIKTPEKPKFYVKNPFKQSICILGPSGKGKSTTTELMMEQLENTEDSDFEFIIPTASTTGLLSQYSPSGRYIKSRLGKMIMSANNNPKKLVTAVFDECHKSAVIEMINDELLQCISIRRNNGKRFISVDEETEDLYPGLEKHRGNLLIPNNFGFIFLSSKPDVIIQNSDFFNRVDIYVLTEQPPKDVDLSLGYDEKGNVILPSYFIKIEGKGKDDEDKIKSLLK